jgi:F-type H+-transporting ATPase subunit delta
MICASDLLIKKFLFVLIDKRRERLLSLLLNSYRSVIRQAKGIILADVQSTIRLTDDNIVKLKKTLEKLTGKEIEIRTSVNPKILGGLIIRIGDKLIDGSVRNRLLKLKKNLLQTVPA